MKENVIPRSDSPDSDVAGANQHSGYTSGVSTNIAIIVLSGRAVFGAKVHGTSRLLELRLQGLGFECTVSGVCAYSQGN